jgi:hypothetical protein
MIHHLFGFEDDADGGGGLGALIVSAVLTAYFYVV